MRMMLLWTSWMSNILHHLSRLWCTKLQPEELPCGQAPHAACLLLQGLPLKKIVKYAAAKGFTDLAVFNEDRKKINGLLLVHLPLGPTAHFKLSSLVLSKDIKVHLIRRHILQCACAHGLLLLMVDTVRAAISHGWCQTGTEDQCITMCWRHHSCWSPSSKLPWADCHMLTRCAPIPGQIGGGQAPCCRAVCLLCHVKGASKSTIAPFQLVAP